MKNISLFPVLRAFLIGFAVQIAALMPSTANAGSIDDVLGYVSKLEQAGVWPASLPPPSTVKNVINIYDKCASVDSDTGLIACIEELLDNPETSGTVSEAGADKWVRLAIAIYLDIKNEDYLQLLIDAGKPLACAFAQILVGFDVCGAAELVAALGGAVVDVVGAFVDGLDAAVDWVECALFSCPAPKPSSNKSIAQVLLEIYTTPQRIDRGLFARFSPSGKPWTDQLALLRNMAKTTRDENGHVLPLVTIPSEPEIQQALTGYIAAVGERWDQELLNQGVEEVKKKRLDLERKDARINMIPLLNAADAAARTKALAERNTKCLDADLGGKMLTIWKQERGSIKPSHPANLQATPEDFCTSVTAKLSAKEAWDQRITAMAKGCSKRANSGDFDAFDCTTYAGKTACEAYATSLNKSLQELQAGGFAKENCATKSAPAGKEFASVLATHDPRGRCVLQADGKTVNCKRDPSVQLACTKAVKDYASDYAGNHTVATNKPIIDVQCKAQRDSEYQGLASQTAAAAKKITDNLVSGLGQSIEQYNAQQSNGALKIGNASTLFAPLFEVTGSDPLLIEVAYTDESRAAILDAVARVSPPLSKRDASDPDNDGQNLPGYVEVRKLTPDQQKALDILQKAIDFKVRNLTTKPSGVNPTTGSNASNPVINPGQAAAQQGANISGGVNPAMGAAAQNALAKSAPAPTGFGANAPTQQAFSASTEVLKALTGAGCKPTARPGVFSCPTAPSMTVCRKYLGEKKVEGCQS